MRQSIRCAPVMFLEVVGVEYRLVIVVFKFEKLRKDILRPVQTLLIYRFGKMTRHNKIISDDSKGKK